MVPYLSLSVLIGLHSYPKIHHLNSCPGGTILSLSMSDNAIMTAFYPGWRLSTGWASSQRRHSSLQYFILCTPIYVKQLIAYHWHCHPVSCLSQCLVTAVFVFLQFMSWAQCTTCVRVRVNFTLFARDHMNCCEKSASPVWPLRVRDHFRWQHWRFTNSRSCMCRWRRPARTDSQRP